MWRCRACGPTPADSNGTRVGNESALPSVGPAPRTPTGFWLGRGVSVFSTRVQQQVPPNAVSLVDGLQLRRQPDPATRPSLNSLCGLAAPGFHLSCSPRLGLSLPCPRSTPLSSRSSCDGPFSVGAPRAPWASAPAPVYSQRLAEPGHQAARRSLPPARAPRAVWARGVSRLINAPLKTQCSRRTLTRGPPRGPVSDALQSQDPG